MISSISPSQIATSYRKKTSARNNNEASNFCGVYSGIQQKNNIPRQTMEQICHEREYLICKFQTNEALEKYEAEKKFMEEVKCDIQKQVDKGINKQYKEQRRHLWQNVVVSADYDVKDGNVVLYGISRKNRNGCYDEINIDENGNIKRIANGILHSKNGNTVTREEFLFEEGKLKTLRLHIQNSKFKNYVMTEMIYSDGKLKELRESVSRYLFGKTIGKREFFNE